MSARHEGVVQSGAQIDVRSCIADDCDGRIGEVCEESLQPRPAERNEHVFAARHYTFAGESAVHFDQVAEATPASGVIAGDEAVQLYFVRGSRLLDQLVEVR